MIEADYEQMHQQMRELHLSGQAQAPTQAASQTHELHRDKLQSEDQLFEESNQIPRESPQPSQQQLQHQQRQRPPPVHHNPRESKSLSEPGYTNIQEKTIQLQNERFNKSKSNPTSPNSEKSSFGSISDLINESSISQSGSDSDSYKSDTSVNTNIQNRSPRNGSIRHTFNPQRKRTPIDASPDTNKSGQKSPFSGGLSMRSVPPQVLARVAGGGAAAGTKKEDLIEKRRRERRELKQSLVLGNVSADSKLSAKDNKKKMKELAMDLGIGVQNVSSNAMTPSRTPSPSGGSTGSFALFKDIMNVENGSLQFKDKTSVHSNGVDFSSGSSFTISTNDLIVQEELGSGNYGTVSKALHRPTGVTLAIKEVKLALEVSKLKQILMELDVLHKCNSPFIVDFFGAFFVENAVYMCIEFMDGGSLDQVYGDGLDEKKLAYITECVVRGLKELKESHNIIHRDVKPTNILVNTQGKVKLCDFGVSGNLVASKAKTNIGCQSYMPPERISDSGGDFSLYTVQSDVWSLGISLIEVALGKYPFIEDSIIGQLQKIVFGDPPKLPDAFSKNAKDFVQCCLRKKAEDRLSYAELLEHPWLVENRELRDELCEEFAAFVKVKVQEREKKKAEEMKRKYAQASVIEKGLSRRKSVKRSDSAV